MCEDAIVSTRSLGLLALDLSEPERSERSLATLWPFERLELDCHACVEVAVTLLLKAPRIIRHLIEDGLHLSVTVGTNCLVPGVHLDFWTG